MVRFGKPRQGSKEVDNGADLVTDASAGLGCQELVETETAVEEERGAPIKTDDSADSVTDAPVEWRFQKAVEQEQAAMESDCCAAGRDAPLVQEPWTRFAHLSPSLPAIFANTHIRAHGGLVVGGAG